MKRITSPLKQGMQDATVNLQDALQLYLERGVPLASDEAAGRGKAEALKRERTGQTHNSAALKLVSLFQEEQQLFGLTGRPSGVSLGEPSTKRTVPFTTNSSCSPSASPKLSC